MIENNAKLKIGESIVIFGAGGVGLNIIQAAKARSAYPIIAVDLYDNRLNLCKEIGATHIINSYKKDAFQEIKSIVGEGNLDIFIDNTGIPKIIEEGYQIISSEGKVILVGVPKHDQNINIFSLPLHFGKTIVGSYGGETLPNIDIPRYLKLFEAKKIDLGKLISKKISLKDINQTIKEMRNGDTAGRVIIEFD